MILDDVELLHDGQALQHNPQAALPQQQASCVAAQVPTDGRQLPRPIILNTPPMLLLLLLW